MFMSGQKSTALFVPAPADCPRQPRQRLLVDRPAVADRRAAEADGDRKSDRAARLQAGADADAETRAGVLQRQLAVAQRLARLLQGPARAHQVGDILTVTVNITDKANIANETQRSRTNKEDSGITDFIGAKTLARGAEGAARPHPDRRLHLLERRQGLGEPPGSLQTNVAAVVTQVLPNGNLVVEGKQEIRVNFEIRELIVAGIVRPEDIQSDNTIDSTKIAQARIAYGGRGQITDVQQPRYGQQVMDVLLPFYKDFPQYQGDHAGENSAAIIDRCNHADLGDFLLSLAHRRDSGRP
jgi:flagellar basal body L-ring protein FlgH